jgi:hypothetical protein
MKCVKVKQKHQLHMKGSEMYLFHGWTLVCSDVFKRLPLLWRFPEITPDDLRFSPFCFSDRPVDKYAMAIIPPGSRLQYRMCLRIRPDASPGPPRRLQVQNGAGCVVFFSVRSRTMPRKSMACQLATSRTYKNGLGAMEA